MGTTRPKYPLAATVFLAMTASTVLRFRSWRRAEATDPGPSDVSRGLTPGRAVYERSWQEVVRMGHRPGTAEFKIHLENEMRRKRMRQLKRQRRKEESPMGDILEEERRLTRQSLANSKPLWQRDYYRHSTLIRREEVKAAEEAAGEIEETRRRASLEDGYEPLAVCGRPAEVGYAEDIETWHKYSCPEFTKERPVLLLEGLRPFGRTANNLLEFLHAVQRARDFDVQLGARATSWATRLVAGMWMADGGDGWAPRFERAFCAKVFADGQDLKGWDIIHQSPKELLHYQSDARLADYIESQEYTIRTLFRNYNAGEGLDVNGDRVRNMCSGIDAIFGEGRGPAVYFAIHSRSLEGEPGRKLLKKVAFRSGCDPMAALEMTPEYVGAILGPLGMLDHPVAFITDGQNSEVLSRLTSDPEIGPLIRAVPEEASWIGGDLALAIMSNVFIGNPASSFLAFIAKSRLALGLGHNYLFRARDGVGRWRTVCGDHCVFDRSVMNVVT